jgi:hypothetical protein
MNLWRKTLLTATVLLALCTVAYAQVYTTTLTYFNVASVESFTVTLPGESAVPATGGGAPTHTIEFNSTDGTDNCVNPCLTAGGTCQSDGTPIFVIDNTGTVNIDVSVNFTLSPPACVKVGGATTYAGACDGDLIDTAAVVVGNDFAPDDTPLNWYEQANFTACPAQETSRTQWVYGIEHS